MVAVLDQIAEIYNAIELTALQKVGVIVAFAVALDTAVIKRYFNKKGEK